MNSDKKIAAIIQARVGSTRLPNKVLKEILGKPMLLWVLNKVKQMNSINKIIVATTNLEEDDRIVKLVTEYDKDIILYRGEVENVLDRYYQAAKENEVDVIVRITSDDPLIDPKIGDLIVDRFFTENADYCNNSLPRKYPLGMDMESFSFKALEEAWINSTEEYQKQHVTEYITENPNKFKIVHIVGENDFSEYRWTVDTIEDFKFVEEVYKRIRNPYDFIWEEVIEILKTEPDLININSHIVQKKYKEI